MHKYYRGKRLANWDIINNGKSKRRFNSDNKCTVREGEKQRRSNCNQKAKLDKATVHEEEEGVIQGISKQTWSRGINQKTRGLIVGRAHIQ